MNRWGRRRKRNIYGRKEKRERRRQHRWFLLGCDGQHRGIGSRYRFEDTRGVAEQSSGVYSPGAAPSHAYLRNSKRRQARLRVHRHTVRSHLRDLHTVQAKIPWTLARFWHRSLLTNLRPPPIRSKNLSNSSRGNISFSWQY